MDKNTQKAWRIGSFCIATYLASYVTRNILSVSTPEMIKEAFFTKEYTGLLSSICFIFYAVGQLINGFIGDRVHPKYMIIMGLGISSVSTFVIPIFDNRTAYEGDIRKYCGNTRTNDMHSFQHGGLCGTAYCKYIIHIF